MVRVADGSGVSVALELWEVPPAGLVSILEREPPGLSIGACAAPRSREVAFRSGRMRAGKVSLADGRVTLGVLGELYLTQGQTEISMHGGWRAYLAARDAAPAAVAAATSIVAAAVPYAFSFPPQHTALVLVDFQLDFVAPGGFGAALGNDVSLLRGALLVRCTRAAAHAQPCTDAHMPRTRQLHCRPRWRCWLLRARRG